MLSLIKYLTLRWGETALRARCSVHNSNCSYMVTVTDQGADRDHLATWLRCAARAGTNAVGRQRHAAHVCMRPAGGRLWEWSRSRKVGSGQREKAVSESSVVRWQPPCPVTSLGEVRSDGAAISLQEHLQLRERVGRRRRRPLAPAVAMCVARWRCRPWFGSSPGR